MRYLGIWVCVITDNEGSGIRVVERDLIEQFDAACSRGEPGAVLETAQAIHTALSGTSEVGVADLDACERIATSLIDRTDPDLGTPVTAECFSLAASILTQVEKQTPEASQSDRARLARLARPADAHSSRVQSLAAFGEEDYRVAADALTRAVRGYDAVGKSGLIVPNSWFVLGRSLFAQAAFEEAAAAFSEAVDRSDQLKGESRTSALCELLRAMSVQKSGNHLLALRTCESARERNSRISNAGGVALAEDIRGFALLATGDHRNAAAAFLSARDHHVSSGEPLMAARSERCAAEQFEAAGSQEVAAATFTSAGHRFAEVGEHALAGDSYESGASIDLMTEHFQSAVKGFAAAARQYDFVPDPKAAAIAEYRLGHAIFESGDPGTAGQCFARAFDRFDSIEGSGAAAASAEEMRGRSLHASGDVAAAVQVFGSARNRFTECGDPASAARCDASRVQALRDAGDLLSAGNAAKTNITLYGDLGDPSASAERARTAAVMFHQGKDYAAAAEMYPVAMRKFNDLDGGERACAEMQLGQARALLENGDNAAAGPAFAAAADKFGQIPDAEWVVIECRYHQALALWA